ncbi:Glycerophosphoryl diester phosphodiesterase family protein [Lachnospiraceae bacterium]|nr:Glycerophosphoryl diester phosphodiesterase family protein [Lachnospiraceae bacterium]
MKKRGKIILKRTFSLILIGALIISLTACGAKKQTIVDQNGNVVEVKVQDRKIEDTVTNYKKTVESSQYMLHALGGMDSKTYINSIDSLNITYNAGYRLFEADVSYTSDDVPVLAHSAQDNVWTESDWNERIGMAYPFKDENGEEMTESDMDYFRKNGYSFQDHTCSYDTFMSFRIQGEYTATSFADIAKFMEKHDDMYLMVDAGNRDYESTQKLYKLIVAACENNSRVLDRIIAGGRTTDMMKAVKETYDFPLLNMYYDSDDMREESIYSTEQFVQYCKDNNITSFSTAKETYNETIGAELKEAGLISYVFTVNSFDEADIIRSYGADIIGTDFLW